MWYICIHTHTYIHIQLYILLLITQSKNNKILSFVKSMNLEIIILNEISQRKRQIHCVVTYFGIQKTGNKQVDMTKQKDSQIQRTNQQLPVESGKGGDDNRDRTLNLWDTAKTVLRGKFIVIQSYLKKEKHNNVRKKNDVYV